MEKKIHRLRISQDITIVISDLAVSSSSPLLPKTIIKRLYACVEFAILYHIGNSTRQKRHVQITHQKTHISIYIFVMSELHETDRMTFFGTFPDFHFCRERFSFLIL